MPFRPRNTLDGSRLRTLGKLFTAIMPDGSERFDAEMAMGRAALFYDIARLLERYVGLPCGISADDGADEHRIDPASFIAFFERLWGEGWVLESHGFVSGWAAHAAGMIENITLGSRRWVDRNGNELSVQRYLRADEIPMATPPEPCPPNCALQRPARRKGCKRRLIAET
jgi:hypothetical protein